MSTRGIREYLLWVADDMVRDSEVRTIQREKNFHALLAGQLATIERALRAYDNGGGFCDYPKLANHILEAEMDTFNNG